MQIDHVKSVNVAVNREQVKSTKRREMRQTSRFQRGV